MDTTAMGCMLISEGSSCRIAGSILLVKEEARSSLRVRKQGGDVKIQGEGSSQKIAGIGS